MTQPALNGQLPQHARQDPLQGPAGMPGPESRQGIPAAAPGAPPLVRVVTWRKAAVIAAAGVPAGLLWWLLAPSGLNLLSGDPQLRSGANTEGWLPRDLVLAALMLLAGCISGAVASGSKHNGPSSREVLVAVGAGALGALAAWGTGVLCGLWWGTPEDTSANASIAFSLRSVAVLTMWPAATALAIFLSTLGSKPAPESGPGAHGADPEALE